MVWKADIPLKQNNEFRSTVNDCRCKNCYDASHTTQMNTNVTQKMRTSTLADAKLVD
jgi:hypothetical protein